MSYPTHRETDAVLRDGSTIHVRPVHGSDRDLLTELFSGLSVDSRSFRFFSSGADVGEAAAQATWVDHRERFGLIAERGGKPVAHAGYWADGPVGEVAFAVADALQGSGIGTILLAHLAERAADCGIERLRASVLPANHRMLEVFRQSGFDVTTRSEPGVVSVEFPSSLAPGTVEAFERRDETAAAAAAATILRPASVAVVGASRNPDTVGGRVFRNLHDFGFRGRLVPVNPHAEEVDGVPAARSIDDLEEPCELAIVAVSAPAVLEVAEACGRKGVRALVVLSAGFAESGDEGEERQRRLLEICRGAGMRMVGPNCLGVLNTDPEVCLRAMFAPQEPRPGSVALATQSGALAIAGLEHPRVVWLSSMVSLGNKADISTNDLLDFWERDEQTRVIALYLESFGNPRKFARVASRVAREKPIVALKSGRSTVGARAASSHTGALLAASDMTVDALFSDAGVIRVDTVSELFDTSRLLSQQRPPEGPRTGIVTNAGGLGIVCADACENHGLEVPELPGEIQRELRSFLPPHAAVANPVDLIATASPADYARAVRAMAPAVDSICVAFVPPLATGAEEVAGAVREVIEELGEAAPPTIVAIPGDEPEALRSERVTVPGFDYPEEAAAALGRAASWGAWRSEPPDPASVPEDAEPERAAALIAEGLAASGPGWLDFGPAADLLACWGVPVAGWRPASDPAEVARATDALGGPVALKAVIGGAGHKTDVGGVALGLAGPDEAGRAAEEMARRLRPEGFVVQRMASGEAEMIVGVVSDPLFGPVVACGAGGTAVELLGDVTAALPPIGPRKAARMVDSLRTAPLLAGHRGTPPLDRAALEDLLTRVAHMASAHPQLAELDLNPVLVDVEGVAIVDVRVRIAEAPPRAPWPRAGA